MLLRLRVVSCFAINLHPLEQPTLPVGEHGLSFTVIFFINTDLTRTEGISIGLLVWERGNQIFLTLSMTCSYLIVAQQISIGVLLLEKGNGVPHPSYIFNSLSLLAMRLKNDSVAR